MKYRCVYPALAILTTLNLTALCTLPAFAQGPAQVQVISNAVVNYSGQTAGDALGTTEPEALIEQGSGVQKSTANRLSDYSSMALDGADGCTFWYTAEFYPASGSFAWATWLASLKFPNCQ